MASKYAAERLADLMGMWHRRTPAAKGRTQVEPENCCYECGCPKVGSHYSTCSLKGSQRGRVLAA